MDGEEDVGHQTGRHVLLVLVGRFARVRGQEGGQGGVGFDCNTYVLGQTWTATKAPGGLCTRLKEQKQDCLKRNWPFDIVTE